MTAELERRVRSLETELMRMLSVDTQGISMANTTVSNPPTVSEINAVFGSSLYSGFVGVIIDDTTVKYWLIVYEGSNRYYVELGKAT